MYAEWEKQFCGKKAKVLHCKDIDNKPFQIVIFNSANYIIGKGSFGQVYYARRKHKEEDTMFKSKLNEEAFFHYNNIFVVKQINRTEAKAKEQRIAYENEIKNLLKVTQGKDSENLVNVYPCEISSQNHFYIIMEYCNQKSLRDLMTFLGRKKVGKPGSLFSFFEICQIILDLVKGYEQLLKANIIHEDIKPENIFIKDKTFKYGDFGLSFVNKDKDYHRHGRAGTKWYNGIQKYCKSLETQISHRSDIFALGIILFEVIYGRHPYNDPQKYRAFGMKFSEMQYKIRPKLFDTQDPNYYRNMKMLDNKVYVEYMLATQMPKLESNVRCDKKYQDCLKQICVIVRRMCSVRQGDRPSIAEVRNFVSSLKLEELVHRGDLFHCLDTLPKDDLSLSLSNLSYNGQSQIVMDPVSSELMQRQYLMTYQNLTHNCVKELKIHMESMSDEIRLFGNILGHLEAFFSKQENELFYLSAFVYRYLLLCNTCEIQYVRDALTVMNESELNQYYASGIDLFEKIFSQNIEYLETQNFLEANPRNIDIVRDQLLNYLVNTCLADQCIDESFLKTYLWLLMYRVLKSYGQKPNIFHREETSKVVSQCAKNFKQAITDSKMTLKNVVHAMKEEGFLSMQIVDDF